MNKFLSLLCFCKKPVQKYKSWRASLKNQYTKENDEMIEYAEMPGGIDDVKKYSRGIHSDEQAEKIRKSL